MQRIALIVCLALLGPAFVAQAQYDPAPYVTRGDIALGYDYVRANAPPTGGPQFNANGAFGSAAYNWKYWLGAVAEVHGFHANDISALHQDLTLISYTAGPRMTFHYGRVEPFIQGTVGASHGSDSYFPTSTGSTTSATALGYTAGGGIDYGVTRTWAVRALAEYLHSHLPNGVNDSEHHLLFCAGIVYRFGGHFARGHGMRAAAPPPDVPVRPALVQEGGTPPPPPPPAPSSRATAEMTPVVPRTPLPPPDEGNEAFHAAVKDAFFDYDSAALRPDALSAVSTMAQYMKSHPGLKVQVGGYSDERGTSEYNLELGEKRANTVKEALIAAGIDGARISIVSYGKGVPVCTTEDDACLQRNRRAGFIPMQ